MDDSTMMFRCAQCSDNDPLGVEVHPEWEHSEDGKHRLICPKCHKATGWYHDGIHAKMAWAEGVFAQQPVKFRSIIHTHTTRISSPSSKTPVPERNLRPAL